MRERKKACCTEILKTLFFDKSVLKSALTAKCVYAILKVFIPVFDRHIRNPIFQLICTDYCKFILIKDLKITQRRKRNERNT